ncbi:glycosyltransferase [Alkalitalea saponilacus]|uniref:Glycosyltransferase involved in cell wall bisynthesis n=1 Tax=Alkalitalea saponilacus TaxID=889453 RepID=A0A1T5HTD4_9BACT|nr:glycosyltransferase [Alkalitalea saponilacus]ASB50201.1 glycosyl transferase group 1 [Alkalitalea saponilacus]SKC23947.1 Glycosyltransferase involved in cell wall bisynthesis [Alkalitalea saponilacus]
MAKKKRIVIAVINNLVTDNRVAKLAGSLEQRGYDVLLIGRRWPDTKIPDGRKGKHYRFSCPVNRGPFFYIYYNIALFWILLFKKSDHIISVDLDTLLACRLAGFLKRVPVVFDSHEYMPETPEVKIRPFIQSIWLFLEKLLLPGVKKGFTVSRGLQDIYRSRYNKEFFLLRNVPYVPYLISEIRPVSDSPIVYYQGALNIGRGLEASILAMKHLPHYKLIIVGSGDIDGDLRQMVINEKLEKQVEFLGWLPFEELSKHATNAHVGLCLLENMGLNYYHSLPNRIFDYPAMGLPVIATGFPDISEIVVKYKTGILLNSMEPKEIAEAIKTACETADLRNEWKENLKRAAQILNWQEEEVVMNEYFPDITG